MSQTAPTQTGRRIERWYDRQTRSWVCQLLDSRDNQLGSAIYVHSKGEAQEVTEGSFWDAPAAEAPRIVKLQKAHPATFRGSTKTGADGRKSPALWNIVDAETGEVLARLCKCGIQWVAFPATGPDEFDFGRQLSRRWAESRQRGFEIAAEVLGVAIAR